MNLIKAEPGDILLFRLKHSDWRSWLRPWAKIIAWVQGNPVTHTAIVIDPDLGVICEAYYPRVRLAIFGNVLEECYEWDVIRPVNSDSEQRKTAARIARSYVGARYDIKSLWDLGKWLLLEKVVGTFVRGKIRIAEDPESFFCQELVSQSYERSGYNFIELLGVEDPSSIVPSDLDYQREKFILIESSYRWPTYE